MGTSTRKKGPVNGTVGSAAGAAGTVAPRPRKRAAPRVKAAAADRGVAPLVPKTGRYAGKRMLVVGLGLSGSSALRYLAKEGAEFMVTDSRAEPAGLDALKQEVPDAQFHLGAFDAPEPLSQFAEAVVSPGVDLREPFVQRLREAGVPVVGDVELFARHAGAVPVVGITGSNGKSTVTTLVGEMAKAAGLKVAVGGNLGTPALDLLADEVELYVLELSSFQLDTTHSLRCRAAAVLNLSEDHLDRHGDMAAYAAAKARVLRGCPFVVLNRDDPAVLAMAPDRDAADGTKVARWSFGLDVPGWETLVPGDHALAVFPAGQLDGTKPEDGPQLGIRVLPLPRHGAPSPTIARFDKALLPLSAVKLAGRHNAANVMAAVALSFAFPVAVSAADDAAAAFGAIAEFKGLPHRCAWVGDAGGARWFNDSKGTNVGAALAAIRGLEAPVIWLAGGQGKGQDFTPLAPALAEKGSAAVLFGEDAGRIEAAILGSVPVYRVENLSAAIERARRLAVPGASVLLSPACASFDQFRSYVDRGEQFERGVQALAGGKGDATEAGA